MISGWNRTTSNTTEPAMLDVTIRGGTFWFGVFLMSFAFTGLASREAAVMPELAILVSVVAGVGGALSIGASARKRPVWSVLGVLAAALVLAIHVGAVAATFVLLDRLEVSRWFGFIVLLFWPSRIVARAIFSRLPRTWAERVSA